jgi:hypothetical protein
MNDRLKPLEIIEVSIRYWWALVILMLTGAVIGYASFTFTPPVYESQAIFSFLIDNTKTGTLTDLAQDGTIVAAGDVFYSTDVVQQVVDAAKKQGILLNVNDFRHYAFIERSNSEWTIRFRSNNPDVSSKIVNIWADSSYEQFKTGMQHARLSGLYQHQLEGLVRCVEQVPSVEPAAPICGFATFSELEENIKMVSEKEISETEQSMSLLPAFSITLSRRSEGPGVRVGEGRSIFILAGALVGLLIFFLFNGIFLSGKKSL